MDRLVSEGKVTRGYLGVYLQPELTPTLMKEFRLPDMNGALVTSVERNSPASKAGLKEGDFVVQFNGRKGNDIRQLQLMVSQAAPDSKVTLKYLRDGKEKSVSMTLSKLPDNLASRGGRSQPGPGGSSGRDALDGVEVTDLDSDIKRQLRIPNQVH